MTDFLTEIKSWPEYQNLLATGLFSDDLEEAIRQFGGFSSSFEELKNYLSYCKPEKLFFILQFKHDPNILVTGRKSKDNLNFHKGYDNPTFAELFKSSPKDVQIKMLSHLDLLDKPGY